MYPYLGDFELGKTIFFPFHTFNAAGASVTITGLAVTDIEIYKNASITQRSSDNGYALVDTDGIDIDGVTGIHGFTVDTNDNTDAGFYAAGSDYTVVVSAITADSQTVSFIAGRFSLINRVNALTAFTLTGPYPHMGILESGTAQSASGNDIVLRAASTHANDTLIGASIMVLGSTQGYWQSALITDSVLSSDTVTVTPNAGWVTPSGTITYIIFGTAASSGGSGLDAAGVRAAVGLASANLDTQLAKLDTIDDFLDTEIAAILAAVDTEVATIVTATTAANIRAALGLASANLDTQLSTIDDFLDTEVAAILAAVDTEITDIRNRLPAALVSGRMDCSVGAMATNTLTSGALDAGAATEIATAVLASALTEPSGVFAWGSATVSNVLAYIGAKASNKRTETATTSTLRNRADSATISTSTNSDAAGTTTKGSDV